MMIERILFIFYENCILISKKYHRNLAYWNVHIMFHVSASTVYKNLLFDVLIDNNGPSSNKKNLFKGA